MFTLGAPTTDEKKNRETRLKVIMTTLESQHSTEANAIRATTRLWIRRLK